MLSFEEAYEQRQYIVSVQQKGLKDSSPGKVYRASQCEASEIPTMPTIAVILCPMLGS